MKVTPLDIQQQQFRLRFRGFDTREVDSFLDLISSQFEELIRENNLLKDKIETIGNTLVKYEEMEKILRETMTSAQKMAGDMKSNTKKEADIIISDAKLRAGKIIHAARENLSELSGDISELKRQKIRFILSLRSTIGSHLKLLEMEEKEGDLKESGDNITSLQGNKAKSV